MVSINLLALWGELYGNLNREGNALQKQHWSVASAEPPHKR